MLLKIENRYTQSVEKLCHDTFVHNFDECWPIFEIFFIVVFSVKFATTKVRVTPVFCKIQMTEIGEILPHV